MGTFTTDLETSNVHSIRFPITNAASQPSSTLLPAGSIVVDARCLITTPFSSGASIQVGQTGVLNAFMKTTDITAKTAGLYAVRLDAAAASPDAAVLVTVGGSPAAGAGVVSIQYVIAPAN